MRGRGAIGFLSRMFTKNMHSEPISKAFCCQKTFLGDFSIEFIEDRKPLEGKGLLIILSQL
jgi:hypothetical protein